MRIFKCCAKVAAVLVFAVCVNAVVTFALEPYGSKSEIMWTDYRQTGDLDTVIFGTSLAERAFDPAVIDAECGTVSFNMATPGQKIEESYLALKTAVKDNDLETAVFGFEYSDVQGDSFPDPGRAFLRNKNKGDFAAAASDTVWCLSHERCYTDKSSINWLFPWVSNHVKMKPSAVVDNVRMKLDGTTVYEAAAANEPGWTYFGRGYGNYAKTFDRNKGRAKIYSDAYGHDDFDDRKLQTLADMCDFCESNGIDLLVVIPPIPLFNVLEYGDKYFEQSRQLQTLIEEHGGSYYDFNLAKPELFDNMRDDLHADFQHLNEKGGELTSRAFIQLLKDRERDEDVASLFYTQDEYHEATKGCIDFVLLDADVVEAGIQMTARALAGKGTDVEYQMCVKNAATGEWEEVRGWSEERSFVFSPDEPGTYEVRVNARVAGSSAEYDRFRIAKVTV